ncbi:hypothetical protein PROFUN_05709 [Planoprotostelium fungivorum]|uniref:protein-histidine N-methyltransferase n=1 Tax=Planoprotostelium fungivorum TaxID=1890364 RepID=A0A2P6NQF9_9EUKA|nr:hypothetical protein PROFUN_05709 [Planoprotostelium fungivorum]
MEAFKGWLDRNIVQHSHVTVEEFAGTGRGMKATKNISNGDTIFSVPRKLFLSVSSSSESLQKVSWHELVSTQLEQIFQTEQISTDESLVILLLHEKSKADSLWKEYFPTLPTQYTNTVCWNDEQVEELRGSNLYHLTLRLKQQVREDFAILMEKTTRWKNDLGFEMTFENYLWALCTVWSRSFDLNMNGQTVRVLVPFADLFNHQPLVRTRHQYDEATDSITCISQESFSQGQQVFFNYGAFPNMKLLRVYGFVIERNPFDLVDLYCPMSPYAPLFEQKTQLLSTMGVSNDTAFGLQSGRLNETLLRTLRIQRIESLSQIIDCMDATKDSILSKDNEDSVITSLMEGLNAMLSAYPTTLESDLRADKLKLSYEERSALVLRTSEKLTIKNHLALLAEKKKAL